MELWNKIRENLLRSPRQLMSEEGADMNFEELTIFAENFSKRLQGEACCAILCHSEMAAAMALLGCFAAGVTAVPLSMRYGENHCRKILDFISPSCIITDEYGELMITRYGKYGYRAPKEHPALIMCTSGTTGTPKGVMLSEKNILASVKAISAYFDIGKDDGILIARPLYHCAVLTGEFLTAIEKGTGIRFYSGSFNPPEVLKLIRDRNITAFCATPTWLSMMSRFTGRVKTPLLKSIVVSGECMDSVTAFAIREAFPKARIYHVYGLTEACPRVSYLPPELFHRHAACVGIPLNGVSVDIRKPDGSSAETNESGLLWVKGDNVMLGYYQNPTLTGKVLQNGWLCTGDVATVNDDGLLKIKGRSDDLIIKAGMNVYPQEIEAVLKTDARVREVLIYGCRHPVLKTQIGLKVAGLFSTIKEIRDLCNRLLPPYQVPGRIELVESIEKNGSGKIIRRRNV